MQDLQPDEAFTELKRPYGIVHRVLSIFAQGAAYTVLSFAALVLWLPLRFGPYLLMVLVVSEIGMSYTYFRVRHQPLGGIMALLIIPAIFLVMGILLRLRTWIMVTRQNLKWYPY